MKKFRGLILIVGMYVLTACGTDMTEGRVLRVHKHTMGDTVVISQSNQGESFSYSFGSFCSFPLPKVNNYIKVEIKSYPFMCDSITIQETNK